MKAYMKYTQTIYEPYTKSGDGTSINHIFNDLQRSKNNKGLSEEAYCYMIV